VEHVLAVGTPLTAVAKTTKTHLFQCFTQHIHDLVAGKCILRGISGGRGWRRGLQEHRLCSGLEQLAQKNPILDLPLNLVVSPKLVDTLNRVSGVLFLGQINFFNEEPAMRNLMIDGAAGGETKTRHDVTFPLLTLHRGKYCVHFSRGLFQKENIVYTGILLIFRTKNRLHIENFAFDA
jgi:hypothetical protein